MAHATRVLGQVISDRCRRRRNHMLQPCACMETAALDALVVVSGCEQLGKGWRRHARQNVDRNRQGGSSHWDFRRTGQSTASQAQVPHSPARYAAGPRGVRPLPRNSNWRSAAVSSRGLHACTPQIGQIRLWGLVGLMCRRWQDLHQHSADSSRALQGRGNCRVCGWVALATRAWPWQ